MGINDLIRYREFQEDLDGVSSSLDDVLASIGDVEYALDEAVKQAKAIQKNHKGLLHGDFAKDMNIVVMVLGEMNDRLQAISLESESTSVNEQVMEMSTVVGDMVEDLK